MKDRKKCHNPAGKIMAWILICALCMASAGLDGHAKETLYSKKFSVENLEEPRRGSKKTAENRQDAREDTVVMEVADLGELQEAVDRVTADEELPKEQESPWQSRRLLVKSETEFDTMGAEHVICGYDQMYILDYASEEAAQAAYKKLKEIPGILVEADSPYSGMSEKSEDAPLQREIAVPGEKAAGGRTVCVAVLDTGYDSDSYGTERLISGRDAEAAGTIQDENGHGTVMANIILNYTPGCVRVMPVKVADENGRTSSLRLYMGIRYAMENGADMIHISMGAMHTSGSQIVGEAIREARKAGIFVVVSAGNAGRDVSSFSPANAEDAIVVSAVNADKSRMSYSNYGKGVAYCSYGKLSVPGLNRENTEYSGTSVSAAIVSAVIAGQMAMEEALTYEALIDRLDKKAEDLGETGRDIYFGKGMLSLAGVEALEEADEETELPELLTCDWRQISDERLGELIGESDELVVRRFLDLRSEEEREAIVKRAPILQHEHVEIICGTDGTEQYRNVDTLYRYLYSERFRDYYVQKKISGTYYMYIQNASRKVYLTTNQDGTKCTLQVKFSGTKTNPADNPVITVSGTSAGAFRLANAKIDGIKTFTDDNGNANTIGQVGITGIEVKKRAHSRITGQRKAIPLKENHGSDLWSGGFIGLGSNKCADTVSTGCKLMVGVGDLELNKDNRVQTYQADLSNYSVSGWGAWTDWHITQNAYCYQAGARQHTHSRVCSHCGKTVDTETKAETIPQLAHDFSNASWKYANNNSVVNGERWVQCGYDCGTAAGSNGYDVNRVFWKKDYQYLQSLFVRYMDADGNYPEYTAFVNGYFPAGTWIPELCFMETEKSEYKNTPGIAGYTVSDKANIAYLDIPRKKYSIVYDGNGANSGSVAPQTVYCGQVFDLNKNGFLRMGYEFLGWSRSPEGNVIKSEGCKNMSCQDGDVVTLYARWKLVPIRIALDNQGADISGGTKEVFERYASGYYKNQEMTNKFAGNSIQIPQKQRTDPSLPGGQRRQQFLGYYTKPDGRGHQMIKKDGFLLAYINGEGAYRYFKEDSTVYAHWQDMYAVQFDKNLTKRDMEILSRGEDGKIYDAPVTCPGARWAEKGKEMTVSFGEAVVQNGLFADIYRFLGWSLTPEINSPDEIVLSKDKPAYTFTADRDVTLYAQWDSSFVVAYVGNGQSSGADYTEKVESVADLYRFSANCKEEAEDYFTKAVQKPTMDIVSGQMQDENGRPYMEQVPYRFLGWSMVKDRAAQDLQEIYAAEDFGTAGETILLKAKEIAAAGRGEGISFGRLPLEFGACSTPHASEEVLLSEDMPVITLYAVWDQYPQILAADLYVPLEDAQNGSLTEEYLLGRAKATDEELKSGINTEGRLKPGMDTASGTTFAVADYLAEEFTQASGEMSFTLTYRAQDKAGNAAVKMIRVHLVDTSGKIRDRGKVRFISEKYIDTLAEDSVWRSGAYADTLAKALGNKKTGEEYTTVTPIQRVMGIKPVLKPGSGTWDHVQEVWEFTHEQVLKIQDYVKNAGVGGDPSGFLDKFGHCRVQ